MKSVRIVTRIHPLMDHNPLSLEWEILLENSYVLPHCNSISVKRIFVGNASAAVTTAWGQRLRVGLLTFSHADVVVINGAALI